jgi:hypothetical protein
MCWPDVSVQLGTRLDMRAKRGGRLGERHDHPGQERFASANQPAAGVGGENGEGRSGQ